MESLDAQQAKSRVSDGDLVEIIEEISCKLRAKEAVDLKDYASGDPERLEQLQQMLPTLQALADLGHSLDDRPVAESAQAKAREETHGALGDFRILREIGRGGMGVVYEAEQISLSRRVALKVLPFAAVLDPRQLKRFKNEAQAAAGLHHTNIVPVYGVGCERGVHYYAMQYIEGQTLAEVIRDLRRIEGVDGEEIGRRKSEVGEKNKQVDSELAESLASGRLIARASRVHAEDRTADYPPVDWVAGLERREPPETDTQREPPEPATQREPQAAISTERSTRSPAYFRSVAQVGIQVAEALDYAHEEGVIHRDVKPSNLILDASGKVWVTDFGLARVEADPGLTMTGDVLGTLRYMSPEQALAKRVVVDHRTDVYSLGVTLYELLTLQPAFPEKDRQELMRRIAFEEPPAIRKLNRGVPADLETIVLKAMSKNPAHRYATARELADDVKRFLEDKPIQARPPTVLQRAAKWSARHRSMVWTGAVSTALFAVFGLVLLAISNLMIGRERDQKDRALSDLKAAYQAKDLALTTAEANFQKAESERLRADGNLDLAMDALDSLYLQAIGQERLLREPDTQVEGPDTRADGPDAQADGPDTRVDEPYTLVYWPGTQIYWHKRLSDQERKLLQDGLEFYAQIAQQNQESPAARFRTARAFLSIGMLKANLEEEKDEAQSAISEAIRRLEELTESHPNNAAYLKELGRAYCEKGKGSDAWPARKDAFAKAEAALTRSIALKPDDADAYDLRANAFQRMSERGKAAADFAKAIELEPNVAWRHRNLAVVEWESSLKKDWQSAVKHMTRAVELEPSNAYFHAFLAECYWRASRDRRRAMAEFDKAFKLDPNDIGSLAHRSRFFLEIDPQRSLEDANRLMEIVPQAGYLRRAEAYLHLGRYEEALPDCTEALRVDPNSSRLYDVRARVYMALGRYEEAEKDFSKGLELAPSNHLLYRNRGRSRARAGQHEAAVADFEKAIELTIRKGYMCNQAAWSLVVSSDLEPRIISWALERAKEAVKRSPHRDHWNTLGVAHYRAGNWKEAIDSLQEAMKRGSAFGYNAVFIAMARWQLEDREQARKWYNAALLWTQKHQPRNSELRQFCGEAAALVGLDADPPDAGAGGKSDDVARWTSVFEVVPDAAWAYSGRGSAYAGLEQWDEAGADFSKAIELGDNSPTAHYWLALAVLGAGDVDAYRRACTAMVYRHGRAKDPEKLNWVAWTRVLADGATDDPLRTVERAEDALSQWPESDEYLNTLGAALYRAGRFQEAADALRRVADGWENAARKPTQYSPAYTWYFLAMAHRRLGHTDDAAKWLDKANEWSDRTLAEGPTGEQRAPLSWNRRLTLNLLREEAESVDDTQEEMAIRCTRALEENPDDPALWVRRARLYFSQGQPEKASSDFAKAVALNPQRVGILRDMGIFCDRTGDLDEAIALFSKAIDLHPDRWDMRVRRGEIYEKLERWDEAAADFCRALELRPTAWRQWSTRARQYEKAEQWDAALALYSKLIQQQQEEAGLFQVRGLRLDPADLHACRGEIYEKLERWDEAAADFCRALELKPKAWKRWYIQAKQYEEAGQRAAALALYSKLIQQQQKEADPGVRVQYAELLAAVGLWKEAAELFLSANGTSGGMHPHQCYLRVLIYVVTGAQERAAEVQETLLEQFADREDDHQRLYSLLRGLTITPVTVIEADDLRKLADQVDRESVGRAAWRSFLIGLTHYRLGQYQKALDRLNEIRAPLPWFRPLFAMVHHQLGDEGEARRYLEEADAWYEQAVVDHLVGEDVKLPVKFWFDWPYFVVMRREAARVVEGCDEWKDPWHHLIRGRVLLRMDEPEKAEEEFQAVLAAQPENPPALAALLERARHYASQGQWQEASADFLKAAEAMMKDD